MAQGRAKTPHARMKRQIESSAADFQRRHAGVPASDLQEWSYRKMRVFGLEGRK